MFYYGLFLYLFPGFGGEKIMKKLIVGIVTAITGLTILASPVFASSTVIYNNGLTEPLPGNVGSEGPEAYAFNELGGQVQFIGTERLNPTVTVMMSSWACESGHWNTGDCVTTPGLTYSMPITLNVYDVEADNSPGTQIKTVTQTFDMPYRPSADLVNCTGGKWFNEATQACFNGKAFPISFDLTGLTLPDKAIISVSYNTTHYGYSPIGEAAVCFGTAQGCFYDSLNIGLGDSPSPGTIPLPGNVYEAIGTGTLGLVTSALTDGLQPTVKVEASSPVTSATIHIFKYVDGVQATTQSVGSVSFPMFTSTYNAPFTLAPGGWTDGDGDYEASTSAITLPASYSAEEVLTTPLVGESCDGTHQYELVGYSTGDTLESAVGATKTTAHPNFTVLEGDKYVIVWNHTCTPAQTLKVHVLKYLDGIIATAPLARDYLFPMTATWKTANLDGGVSTSGNYVLGNSYGGAGNLYGADTSIMNAPADYSTSEITGSTSNVLPVGAQCALGKFRLVGYKSSSTSFTDAWASSLAPSAVFDGLTSDKFVIVANESCVAPETVDACKKDGWKLFNTPKFKNQGDCVSYVQSNPNASGNKKDNL
ncbi:TPA: hypothetical protein DEP93_00025 [candidate division WWE3 bacterium]|uniref:Uncharacterized protein n=1 Tax=candidate division WWE3 bacterium TaxID=2053526 RepID=A0A3D0ZQ78_UNCKA|nr:MAG: hypothetical protein A2245_00810 [candidate division WWE3 bacterium RIFOXYA2_FULL_43_12]HCC41848.1 hypothetical protein [candidate division WWE3 bacterium]